MPPETVLTPAQIQWKDTFLGLLGESPQGQGEGGQPGKTASPNGAGTNLEGKPGEHHWGFDRKKLNPTLAAALGTSPAAMLTADQWKNAAGAPTDQARKAFLADKPKADAALKRMKELQPRYEELANLERKHDRAKANKVKMIGVLFETLRLEPKLSKSLCPDIPLEDVDEIWDSVSPNNDSLLRENLHQAEQAEKALGVAIVEVKSMKPRTPEVDQMAASLGEWLGFWQCRVDALHDKNNIPNLKPQPQSPPSKDAFNSLKLAEMECEVARNEFDTKHNLEIEEYKRVFEQSVKSMEACQPFLDAPANNPERQQVGAFLAELEGIDKEIGKNGGALTEDL